MSALTTTNNLFFTQAGLDQARLQHIVDDTLRGMDDGELYLEYRSSENLVYDDGKLKSASTDTAQGFGLRGVVGEVTGLAHATALDEAAIIRASGTVKAVKAGHDGAMAMAPMGTNQKLYGDDDPNGGVGFDKRIALLQAMDAYLRGKDARVAQVSISLGGQYQAVHIMRAGGQQMADIRPLVRFHVNVVMKDGARQESGWSGWGGRMGFESFMDDAAWQAQCDIALKMAETNLQSVDAPAGEMTVVLGPGYPGVLLHEAVGHGLEGDFNRKKTSVFSGLMGQQVAAKGVTVIDDGGINQRRGSLTIDDEGTPTQRNVLIEDGILVGLMHDRMNARLMGKLPTGNGRRQSYAHKTLPRMTNTFMVSGPYAPEEIIASVKNGIYAAQFGGGQVDITSGQFVFSAQEAYKIENGKITVPIKGATLVGSGADALKRISMIGHDSALDHGTGTCGKDGQSVPVGVGQPTLRLDAMTVGGAK